MLNTHFTFENTELRKNSKKFTKAKSKNLYILIYSYYKKAKKFTQKRQFIEFFYCELLYMHIYFKTYL